MDSKQSSLEDLLVQSQSLLSSDEFRGLSTNAERGLLGSIGQSRRRGVCLQFSDLEVEELLCHIFHR